MSWPGQNQAAQWNQAGIAVPDMNSGSYNPEQWAMMQQQNWQQWSQWQQQYSQWQNHYGDKYAQQLHAVQGMAGVPPPPPTTAAPPLPPDKPPPPPPHENNQPLFNNKDNQISTPPQAGNNVNSNTNSSTGNNQWSYSAANQQPAVNAEALKKLAEEERLFDIQFQKWEEEIEKWRQENVNHPDKQAYTDYESKFEACRKQLLERRQQMNAKRANLLSNPPVANSTGNTSVAPQTSKSSSNQNNFSQKPQIKNSQNHPYDRQYTQNPQSQKNSKNNSYERQYEPNNRSNKNVESQDRYDSYNQNDIKDNYSSSGDPAPQGSDNSAFLKSSSSKGIPGLDLVPDSTNKNQEVIDLSDDQPEIQTKAPDYSTISMGINNILGDEKIMNILSMVQGFKGPQGTDTNNATQPNNQANRNENFNHTQHTQSMPNNHSGQYQNQNMNSQNHQVGNYNRQDSVQDQYFDQNKQFGGPNRGSAFGGPQGPLSSGPPRPGMQQGGPGINQGRPGMNQSGPGMQQGGPGMQQGGPGMQHGGPSLNQGRPGMNQSGPGMSQGRPGMNQGGPGMNQGGPGMNQGRPGMSQGRPGINQGGPIMQQGMPNMQKGGPNTQQGGPNVQQGGPIMQQGGPNMHQLGPNVHQVGRNMQHGGPNIQHGGPNIQHGGSNTQHGGSNMQHEVLNMQHGVPNMQHGGSNMPHGGPHMQHGGSNMPHGGPHMQHGGPNVPQRGGVNMQGANMPQPEQLMAKGLLTEMPPQPPNKKWIEDPLFTPSVIVEYDHKSLRLKARDFIEPVHTFDYNHISKEEYKKKDFEHEADELFTRKPRRSERDFEEDRYRDQGKGKGRDINVDVYERRGIRDDFREMPRDVRDIPRDIRDMPRDIRDIRGELRDSRDMRDVREPRNMRDREPRDYAEPRDVREREIPSRDEMFARDRARDNSRDRARDNSRDGARENSRDIPRSDFDNRRDDRNGDKRRDDLDRHGNRRIVNEDVRDRDYNRGRRDDHRDSRRRDNRIRSNSRDRDSRKRGISRESETSNHSKKSKDVKDVPQNNPLVMIDDLLEPPGRAMRPAKIVIILRGLPGSGKSYLAKLIRDREAEHGGTARIMSIDDYFMQEGEIEETDPATGKTIKKPSLKYEYDGAVEETYTNSLKRAFKRSLTDGYFSFLIYDAPNSSLHCYADIWNFARQNGFQVYICTLELDVKACFKRNIHNRTLEDIEVMASRFFTTPAHHIQLDPTTLLQNAAIEEVDMEDVQDVIMDESEAQDEVESVFTSKWEKMDDANKLARLDGISKPLRPSQLSMEQFLQLDDWTPNKARPGKKTVRWADLEERREQEKMRAIGFVVGQTDWNRMTDPTMGSSALTQTKYIERVKRK